MLVSQVYAPVRQQTLRNLRKAITEGRFQPGERLRERDLCRFTGVSRTSVREALRHLETEGLIIVVANKGPSVATVTLEEAKDIYQTRQMLEGLACQLFVERATSREIVGLVRKVELLEKLVYKGDLTDLIRAKNDFYDIILRGCRNKVVHSFIRSLLDRITFLRLTSLSQPGRPFQSLGEIKRILDAIQRRDSYAARRACLDHVLKAEAVALQALCR